MELELPISILENNLSLAALANASDKVMLLGGIEVSARRTQFHPIPKEPRHDSSAFSLRVG